jgi:hypothetical protein
LELGSDFIIDGPLFDYKINGQPKLSALRIVELSIIEQTFTSFEERFSSFERQYPSHAQTITYLDIPTQI